MSFSASALGSLGKSGLLRLFQKSESKSTILTSCRSFRFGNEQFSQSTSLNGSSQARKRFYKKVATVQSHDEFEIILDNRKLKTPAGQIFRVSSKPLALAVVNEWDAQHEKVLVSSMHITSLVNTIIDNPNKLLKHDIVSHILTYLDNDTLLCREEGNEEWSKEQSKEWDPLVNWFNDRFRVNVESSTSITGPNISKEAREALQKHLHSYDFSTLNGLMFAVETAKSLILTLACVDRRLLVEEGIRLATLETDFQTRQWGRVEWAHDVDTFNLQSRFAASILFVHLTSGTSTIESKLAL